MCGIVAIIGTSKEGHWGQTYRMFRELLLASEHRGRDATGFVARTQPEDNPSRQTTIVAKAPVPATEFVGENPGFRSLGHRRCSLMLGHVRAATHGSPSNPLNNHPFVSEAGDLYLVHNGVVGNHEEILDKWHLNATMKSECDSEVLLRLVEQADDPLRGMQHCIREVVGSTAVVLFDQRTESLLMARNGGRGLHLCRLQNDRRWFLASEGEILLKALRKVMGEDVLTRLAYFAPVPTNTVVTLTHEGRLLAAGAE